MLGKPYIAAIARRLRLIGPLRRARDKARLAYSVWRCRRNHAHVLHRLRSKAQSDKIRVLFLCNNTAKWKCQSVYECMEASGVFEPVVAITALGEMGAREDDELQSVFAEADAFFDELGDRHVRACSLLPRHYEDLRRFNPDIVFFPEPWAIKHPQTTAEVSHFALPCYVPYFVTAHIIPEKQCLTPMHRYLFAYFTQNVNMATIYEDSISWLFRSYRTISTGHPALDMLGMPNLDIGGVQAPENMVIYAPHYSIQISDHRHPNWRIGTFLETGRFVLDYARRHPKVNWVFKPHPQLRNALQISGLWTEEDIDDYYAEWGRIGTVCTDGNYQDLFLKSKAMITDSGSFLIEYGITGKALIHLVPHGAGTELSPHIKDLLDAYYRVESPDELANALDLIIERGEDPKRQQRLTALRGTQLLGVNAAQNIVDYLRKLLRR